MPDEITTAPPQEWASPAPAGNPPAEQAGAPGESTKTPDSKPINSNSLHARQRILEKENARLKAEQEKNKPSTTDDDDWVDPDEADVVKKVVDKHFWNRFDEIDTRTIQEDVEKTIKDSQYSPYMTLSEKESVQKLALDPKYANLSYDDLIYISLKDRMIEISADIARKASEKINDTRIPTSGSSTGTPSKSVLEMNDAEYAEYRKQNGIR